MFYYNLNKNEEKNTTKQPLKRKWSRPIDPFGINGLISGDILVYTYFIATNYSNVVGSQVLATLWGYIWIYHAPLRPF